MAIQVMGNGGTIGEVETNTRALKVTQRPDDAGSLGHYALSWTTGVMAAGLAANSEVLQFRWTHATNLCAIRSIRFDGAGGIVAFAAGSYRFEAMIARSFTVAGTGGTAATLTTNNAKLRSSFGTTVLGEYRGATTAALTAGTKTLDAQGIGAAAGGLTVNAGDKMSPGVLFDGVHGNTYPIVLATNEGVIIRATVPATGTWTGAFTVVWEELTAY